MVTPHQQLQLLPRRLLTRPRRPLPSARPGIGNRTLTILPCTHSRDRRSSIKVVPLRVHGELARVVSSKVRPRGHQQHRVQLKLVVERAGTAVEVFFWKWCTQVFTYGTSDQILPGTAMVSRKSTHLLPSCPLCPVFPVDQPSLSAVQATPKDLTTPCY